MSDSGSEIRTTRAPDDCQWMWDAFQWQPLDHEPGPPCWPPLRDGAFFGEMATTGRMTTPPPGGGYGL